ncbi:CRISPR-associated helicase Cas3' [Metabacillus iocasae]|uniref:CRISPR-associated endonuclease/helicase Cas3 n=1 Tax=Priestia iocasae TaxID=2291674 RepID=A0ABS2QVC8_9BACI|nr:CRISPR-associated endonuclease/helicase Cas3 [Metabacillus iocasae]
MNYIAHIRESDRQIQTVEEHLLGVKELAEAYGEKLGVKHLTGLAGMLHDLGKYTVEFRDYITEAVTNPTSAPKRGSVDHSTAGGRLLYQLFHSKPPYNKSKALIAEIVGNAIISHHSYLQDFLSPDLESNYLHRVRDKQAKELDTFEMIIDQFYSHVMAEEEFQRYIDQAAAELDTFLMKQPSSHDEKKIMFLSKFIFSTLIDADRTNTRLFEENKENDPKLEHKQLFDQYYERLMNKMNSFKADTIINQLRADMSNQCDQFAQKPSGIYTLSIPTGGGKTLASLRYALKHASLYQKKRIIYVVPYTTIIEQNAKEIRSVLMDDYNILEHHSNVIHDSEKDDEGLDGVMNMSQKLKHAKDNWDAPIILTTMVQFLNVFYAKGNRNTRRLHNLSESIIIFDEVQKVPISCVSLFNDALNFLHAYGKSSMILCTATQPALDFVEHRLEIEPDQEIISNVDTVIESFKRVEIVDRATNETFNNNELIDFIDTTMKKCRSILVILNTKSVVKNLYKKLQEKNMGIAIYHLSTSMCAAHRHIILDKVRNDLKKGQPVICVSTQLIEAGVDISFDCVIRSLAGLDSIAQAAGRCNRHGEKDTGHVYVIDHEEENLSRLKEIKQGKQIAKTILLDLKRDKELHGGHILSRQAMEFYFKRYYTAFESSLDYSISTLEKTMVELLTETKHNYSYHKAFYQKEGKQLPLFLANSYKTAANHFEVIPDYTTSVIVPYGEGKQIIAELNGKGTIEELSRLLKTAQQFTINIYQHELQHLSQQDGIVSYLDGHIFVLKEGAYSEEYGLNLENDSLMELNIF